MIPRSSPVARRRRFAVAAAAVLALGVGLALGAAGGDGGDGDRGTSVRAADATSPAAAPEAPPTPAERAQAAVARMSLERQVGELIVISFSGTSAPAYVLDALHGHRAAGVILFGGNARSAASVRALSASVQRAAGGDAIVCLDQEGGEIRILKFAPPASGQASQPTPAAARASATATARALHDVGVNVTLGPVADVAAQTPGSVMAGRAFPGDGAAVRASVAAAVGAYRRAGIAPTLKHFPGLGGATANTDFDSAAIDRSRAQLVASDLVPYGVAVGGGAGPHPLVMLNHARYPALDANRIASQSRAVATGLLRETLGFDGVAITDSLEAQAVDDATPGDADVGLAAVRSLDAGVDLMLLTGPGSFPLVRTALIARARSDPAFRVRVAQAAARVVRLRVELRAAATARRALS